MLYLYKGELLISLLNIFYQTIKDTMSYNQAFNEIELAKHNYYRALHGSPPMVIDVEAAKSA